MNVDLCIKNDESLRTGPAYVIGNSNYTFHNSTTNTATSPAQECQNCGNMTTTYSRFATNVPAFLRFFLNVSAGQPPGVYSNSVIFQAVSTGSSVTCASATLRRRSGGT